MNNVNVKIYKRIHNILDSFTKKADKEVAMLGFMCEHQDNKEVSYDLIEYAFIFGLDQCLGLMLQSSKKYRDLFATQNSAGVSLYHRAMDYDLPFTCMIAMTCCVNAASIQDTDGNTFLHRAVIRGHKATCDTIPKMLIPNYRHFGPILENFRPEPHLSPSYVEIKNNEGKSVRDLYREKFFFDLPSKEYPKGLPTKEHVD